MLVMQYGNKLFIIEIRDSDLIGFLVHTVFWGWGVVVVVWLLAFLGWATYLC